MRRLTVALSAWLLAISMQGIAQQQLPEAIQHITQFEKDPIALVDAARRYQDQQLELIRWDATMVQKHRSDNDRGLAEAKRETITKRVDNVRMVWEYVLGRYPNDPRALNYFGEYWYDLAGEEMSALTIWKRASMMDNEYGLADNNLGIYYFHIGNYTRGHDYLAKALDIDKNNPDYLFNMAQMYLNHYPDLARILETTPKKLYKEAMSFSKKAMQNAPDDFELAQDYAVNFFAAVNFDIDADWKKAAAAWAHARTLATADDELYFTTLNEARCLMRAGREEEAVPLLESALEITPDSVVVQELLADARGEVAPE